MRITFISIINYFSVNDRLHAYIKILAINSCNHIPQCNNKYIFPAIAVKAHDTIFFFAFSLAKKRISAFWIQSSANAQAISYYFRFAGFGPKTLP